MYHLYHLRKMFFVPQGRLQITIRFINTNDSSLESEFYNFGSNVFYGSTYCSSTTDRSSFGGSSRLIANPKRIMFDSVVGRK